MKILAYEICLLEPALITALDGDPNSSLALPYVPGSVLRGALIQRYILQQKKTAADYQFDPTNDNIRPLFFDGQTRFLNGYVACDGQRSLPAPLSWQHKKGDDDGDPIYDFAYEDASWHEPDTDWQGIKDCFCTVVDDSVQLVKPERLTAVHIARDRHTGRKTENEAERRAVYRYVSLAAGQTFSAAIICPDAQCEEALRPLLAGQTWVGGSRTAGYGRAKLTHLRTISGSEWREVKEEMAESDDRLFVTFVSDGLLRDPHSGQYVVNPLTIAGIIKSHLDHPVEFERAFLRTAHIGGFNRKWGLPLPQATAVKMGSVFVFKANGRMDIDRLRQLEQNGLGERRAEGFGRILVNWHKDAELTVNQSQSVKPSPVKITTDSTITSIDSTITSITNNMLTRMLREKLDTQLAESASNLSRAVKGVNKTQLNRLRMVVQDELFTAAHGQERLLLYLKQLKERPVTRKQFEWARVEGRPLLDWLESCFTSNDLVQGWPTRMPQIGDRRADKTPELIYEYNLRLVEAVLAQAAKKAGDE